MSDTKPAANSLESLQAAIDNYKQQHAQCQANLQELDKQYAEKKDQLLSTLKMLVGACAALEQVTKNIADEDALKSKDAATELVVTEPQPA